MSRLGKRGIPLIKGIEVKEDQKVVRVKGPKGTLLCPLKEGFTIRIEEGHLWLDCEEDKGSRAQHGLYRSLLNNMVTGVSKGFEKRLSLIGVGYRAQLIGKSLELQLGYSHPIKMSIPDGLQVAVDKNVLIIIAGNDKQLVGHFAAKVRAQRPPEPYKGKGIRYENEVVRKKAGKAAKGKAG
jgi:large subunit ribosomal protein L6